MRSSTINADNKSVGRCNIAGYLRLSQEDGADAESNSIRNQREIIKHYISNHADFNGAKYIDYVDDGFSGETTDRDAYSRMLEDIERGEIDCIVVKDAYVKLRINLAEVFLDKRKVQTHCES